MPSVLSLEKSLAVLEAVVGSARGLGTRALEQRLGYNVATIHNIARTFCERGYLRQDPETRQFHVGTRLMLLGRHSAGRSSLTEPIGPVIDTLAMKLNESILLATHEGERIIRLYHASGRQALHAQDPDDLTRYAHGTATGKVLLAALPEHGLKQFLSDHALERFTPATLVDSDRLHDEIAVVRERGYALTRDECADGVSAVAIPVLDPWGGVAAGLGASAPTLRMDSPAAIDRILTPLRDAARQLTEIWGATSSPHRS